jgi:hypothetical protein
MRILPRLMQSRPFLALAFAAFLCSVAAAQTYDDLMLVRNRPSPYASLLQVRAGLLGSIASKEDPAVGLEDTYGLDGHVYFRDDQFGGREGVLQAYAGRDGGYFGVKDNLILGKGNQTNLEVHGRLWPYYREGFYRGDDFVPTGRYEGSDWGAALGFSREVDEGLRLELSAFYKRYSFDRNDATSFSYVIPDNFSAYGGRITLEHNTLTLDRVTGRPDQGFIFTVRVEREQNDSEGTFGVSGGYTSSLPSGLWRGRGHLEWYFPQTDSSVWELVADGSLSDDKDRVYNYDAQKPAGSLWVDAQLRYRMEFSGGFAIAPFAHAQYLKILEESGASSATEFFFGGGVKTVLDLGENMALFADYSYLTNESRAPVSTSRDTFGEQMFFIGAEVRFGAARR